ncbi:hypothetical protein AGRA3207_006881 [Actinomadura graeca]|uniref:Cell division protein FtsL n=1 Tax=Actinomadura graeca TaxID=2750812 RepID=A0ABX8R2V5_9ACTN|nr:hypothetical protein [Actinomadura graeca]QXJ25395.1 hypothetical protein AGRA3207_006881 [Actinomadura graeca]
MTTTTGRPPAAPPARKAPEKKAPEKKAPARPAGGAAGAARATPAKAAPVRPEPAPKAKETAKAPAAGARKAGRAARQAPPRAPFVLLICGLLGGALVSLLLLNTVLAKDAFTLTRLQQSNKMLEQQRQAYEEEIAREDSPQSIAGKARNLGMKPREGMAFVDGDTGRTSGPSLRPVPHSAAASAGAASVLGIPGTVVPGDPRAHGAPAGTDAP